MLGLHWLCVKKCITYKIAVIMYKCVMESAPKYLRYLVTTTNHRSSIQGILPVSISRTSLVHNSSFKSMGPQTWNCLPRDTRDSTTLKVFKKKLKMYLIRISY